MLQMKKLITKGVPVTQLTYVNMHMPLSSHRKGGGFEEGTVSRRAGQILNILETPLVVNIPQDTGPKHYPPVPSLYLED